MQAIKYFAQLKENITGDKREFIDIIQDGYSYIPILKNHRWSRYSPSFLYLTILESGLSNHTNQMQVLLVCGSL